jgi:hydrogenase nickel incorporation protein HypB
MRVQVLKNILKANDEIAAQNRARFDEAGILAVNFMASPGAGKTSLILNTIERLREHFAIAVIEGDLASSLDAERIDAVGIPVVQINTGGGCHLDANMIRSALADLPRDCIDLLLIENVGNLVCPANFQLGAHLAVVIASVPEGDDKPYKYPGMFSGLDALVLNKIDLAPYAAFDMERFRRGAEMLSPGTPFFLLSCRTGEGLDAWSDWLARHTTR